MYFHKENVEYILSYYSISCCLMMLSVRHWDSASHRCPDTYLSLMFLASGTLCPFWKSNQWFLNYQHDEAHTDYDHKLGFLEENQIKLMALLRNWNIWMVGKNMSTENYMWFEIHNCSKPTLFILSTLKKKSIFFNFQLSQNKIKCFNSSLFLCHFRSYYLNAVCQVI